MPVENFQKHFEPEQAIIEKNREDFKDTLPSPVMYYVARSISPRQKLSKSIFSSGTNDIFVVTGVERHHLTILANGKLTDSSRNQVRRTEITVSFILLERVGDWTQLQAKATKPIHLISCDYAKQDFIWVESRGEVKILQNHIIYNNSKQFAENDFIAEVNQNNSLRRQNRPVIISDSPGMGKSILLAEIGRKLQHLGGSSCRVIYVVMGEWITKLKEYLQHKTGMENGIMETLCNNACLNELAVNSLTLHFSNTEESSTKLELLFDGFDEIHSAYFQLATDALKFLINSTKNVRVWVTTRPHMLDILENCLGVLGYNIIPFTTSDQTRFLKMFWSQGIENAVTERLSHFAKSCLERLKSQMNSHEDDIAGIPLQCMLIAEAFSKEAKSYAELENAEPEFEWDLNVKTIMDLYDLYLSNMLSKYILTLQMQDSDLSLSSRELKNAHSYLAFRLILPLMELDFLQFDIDAFHFQDLYGVGIVVANGSQDAPRFIHRTFAEYFIARSMAECMGEGRWNSTSAMLDVLGTSEIQVMEVDDFLKVPTCQFTFPVICYFLDSMLERQKNTTFVQLPDFELAEVNNMLLACSNASFFHLLTFLRSQIPNRNTKWFIDWPGIVLNAVYKSSREIVHCIGNIGHLTELCQLNAFDYIEEKTALHLAIKRGNYSIVEYLLNFHGFRQLVEVGDRSMNDLMQYCLEETEGCNDEEISQRLQTLKLLLELRPDFLNQRDEFGTPPLLAGEIHIDLIIKLITRGATITGVTLEENQTLLHHVSASKYVTSGGIHRLLLALPRQDLENVVNLRDEDGNTFLHYLVFWSNIEKETLDLLKHCGADFNAINSKGKKMSPKMLNVCLVFK